MLRSYSFISKATLWNGFKGVSIYPAVSNLSRNSVRLFANEKEMYSRDLSAAESTAMLNQALQPVNTMIKKRLQAVREEFAPLRNFTVMENFDRMTQLVQMSKNPAERKNFRQGVKDLLEKQKQDIAKGLPEKRLQSALAKAIAGPVSEVVDTKKSERLIEINKEKDLARQRLDEDIKHFQAEMDLAEKERKTPVPLFYWTPPPLERKGTAKHAPAKESHSHGSH